jgi:hypothetical protein
VHRKPGIAKEISLFIESLPSFSIYSSDVLCIRYLLINSSNNKKNITFDISRWIEILTGYGLERWITMRRNDKENNQRKILFDQPSVQMFVTWLEEEGEEEDVF